MVCVVTGCPLRLPQAALAGDPLHEWMVLMANSQQDVLLCSKDMC